MTKRPVGARRAPQPSCSRLAVRPDSRAIGPAAAVVLASLIGAYALSVTTGLPWLAEAREPVDGVGLATKTVEALGLAVALRLDPTTGGRRSPDEEVRR